MLRLSQLSMRFLNRLDDDGAVDQQIGNRLVDMPKHVIATSHGGVERKEKLPHTHHTNCAKQQWDIERLRLPHSFPEQHRSDDIEHDGEILKVLLEWRESLALNKGTRQVFLMKQHQPVDQQRQTDQTPQQQVA